MGDHGTVMSRLPRFEPIGLDGPSPHRQGRPSDRAQVRIWMGSAASPISTTREGHHCGPTAGRAGPSPTRCPSWVPWRRRWGWTRCSTGSSSSPTTGAARTSTPSAAGCSSPRGHRHWPTSGRAARHPGGLRRAVARRGLAGGPDLRRAPRSPGGARVGRAALDDGPLLPRHPDRGGPRGVRLTGPGGPGGQGSVERLRIPAQPVVGEAEDSGVAERACPSPAPGLAGSGSSQRPCGSSNVAGASASSSRSTSLSWRRCRTWRPSPVPWCVSELSPLGRALPGRLRASEPGPARGH